MSSIRSILVHRLEKLDEARRAWEWLQTEYSYDRDFYRYCEWWLNQLDEDAEKIRILLEGNDN